MVAATREMVETASRSQTLALEPRVECRTVNYPSPEEGQAGAAAGQMVSETTITNIGPHRVRLSRVRLETDSGGEHIRRFVTHWVEPGGHETVLIPFGTASRTKVLVHLEDMAGQSHTIVSEPA
jgi:P pilus assembly chaperone PapD